MSDSNFGRSVKNIVNRHLLTLKVNYHKGVADAETRARQRLEEAQTRAEKQRIVQQLNLERHRLNKEMYEAKVATQRAAEAARRARIEAGDLTLAERVQATYKAFTKPAAPVKRRTATAKPSTRKKATTTTKTKTRTTAKKKTVKRKAKK